MIEINVFEFKIEKSMIEVNERMIQIIENNDRNQWFDD